MNEIINNEKTINEKTINENPMNENPMNEKTINEKIKTIVKTILQFVGWYMFIHTIFWSLEQIKYTWCHKGFIQSLIFSPSPMCVMLSETTNLMTRTQITSMGQLLSLFSFR